MAYILAQAKGGSGGGITKVQIPSVVIGSYTYDGTAQGPTITGLDTTHCNVTGTTSATNAGTYTITISLKDPDTMIWNDISVADKVYTWSIAKASQSLSLSANSVTLDNDHLTGTVTVSGAMTSLSVSSSDTNIATASVNGSTVTIDDVDRNNGTATITITAETTTNYNGATATIAVSVAFGPDSVLNNNNWATIQTIAQAGTGANYWSVGDRKAVTLNGTVGIQTFNNETYYVYILGFNHNQALEGTAIHFQFGFDALSGGNHIAFADANYNNYSATQCFNMNPAADAETSTNAGGWASCGMRNVLIPEFIAALPASLQSALKAITKYTDNTGLGSNTAANVTATSDKVFLLTFYETIADSVSFVNSYEYTKQAQYDYYANGNTPIMKRHNALGNVYYYMRSPRRANNEFVAISNTGGIGRLASGSCYGFAPGFAVG